MGLFSDIEDPLTAPLPAEFQALAQDLEQLAALLQLDSYTDLGGDDNKKQALLALDTRLRAALALPVHTNTAIDAAPRAVKKHFAAAWLLCGSIRDSVGPAAETISTSTLGPYQNVALPPLSTEQRLTIFTALCEQLHIGSDEQQSVIAEQQQAQQRMHSKRELMDRLRARVCDIHGNCDRQRILALHRACYGEQGFTSHEIGLVATRSACHFTLPKPEACSSKQAQAFVLACRKFRFEQFSHFPMFGPFDGREAQAGLVRELATDLAKDEADIREDLTQVITCMEEKDLDKYLIHDTWGHIWQAECTPLRTAYDYLATLQVHFSVDEHVSIDDHNIVSLADICYPDESGTIIYQQQRAERLCKALVRKRSEALMYPILAELAADIIEYGASLDNQKHGITIPNSSMLGDRPGKPDLALADMGYFTKALIRPLKHYQRNIDDRRVAADRLAIHLKQRYRKNAAKVPGNLGRALLPTIERFMDQLVRVAEDECTLDLRYQTWDGTSHFNASGQIFANLLRLQYVVGSIYRDHLEQKPELLAHRDLLTMFICRYPMQHIGNDFWNLDETLAEWALPFINWFAEQVDEQR